MKIAIVAVVAILLLAAGAFMFADDTVAEPIEKTGTVLEDSAKLGLVVPTYTYDKGIHNISDLEANSAAFNGEIVGIDAGAGIMSMAEKAVEEYELESFSLLTSADATMMTVLKDAIAANNDVVVTLWNPHWAFGVYDLTYLDDPELVFGEAESIESWSRPGFSDDESDVASILANYTYTTAQFGDLLAAINENETLKVSVVVEQWAENNPTLVDTWKSGMVHEADRGEITIGLVNWACAEASSNMIAFILEELGWDVTISSVSAGPMYQGLSQGDIDFITTAWVPLTHAAYMDQYA